MHVIYMYMHQLRFCGRQLMVHGDPLLRMNQYRIFFGFDVSKIATQFGAGLKAGMGPEWK